MLVFEAHRLLFHSTLALRVIKKKKKVVRLSRGSDRPGEAWQLYRGTSLIRNRPPPKDHHRNLGIVLL